MIFTKNFLFAVFYFIFNLTAYDRKLIETKGIICKLIDIINDLNSKFSKNVLLQTMIYCRELKSL